MFKEKGNTKMALRTRLTFGLAAIIAALGLLFGLSISSPSQAATSNICVQAVNGHGNWECVIGHVYWTDNLLTREIYLHPSAGDQVVMEQFFCQNDQEITYGHPSCKSNSPGVPTKTPRWERRIISLSGGCTVYGWNVAYNDRTPPAPTQCVLYNGHERALTSIERRSVLDFWRVVPVVRGYW